MATYAADQFSHIRQRLDEITRTRQPVAHAGGEAKKTWTILFPENSALIPHTQFGAIDNIAIEARRPAVRNLLLGGHADIGESGRDDLARRRADEVRAALSARGIPLVRLLALSYAARDPVDQRDAARNRRVTIKLDVL